MRLKYYVLGLIAAASMLSCKVDKKESDKNADGTEATSEKSGGNVQIVLDMVVPKNDVFELFYNENGAMDYTAELSKRVPVKGQEGMQQIVFDLKDDALPTTIRLDLGENAAQEKMTVSKITIKYYEKSLVITGPEVTKYFDINDNLVVDKATGTLTPKPVNNNYDPMGYPSGNLINALKPILTK